MSELLSSLSKWFSEKANSPLYWTYFGFFVAWNWKFFQIIFLEDPSLFDTPRVEYLSSLLYAPFGIQLVNWIVNVLYHIVPPILFTYLAIVYLPTLHKWAFEIHLTHHFDRRSLFQEKKALYEEKMARLLKKEATAKKERIVQETIIEQNKSVAEKAEEEFSDIKTHPIFNKFNQIVDSIYKYGGRTNPRINGDNVRIVDTDTLAFFHSRGLVNIKLDKSNYEIIELTDKGKLIVSKYLEERK